MKNKDFNSRISINYSEVYQKSHKTFLDKLFFKFLQLFEYA